MKIGPDEAKHVARLAELAVADPDLPVLASQLERIVSFVEQLGELELSGNVEPVVMGPPSLRLREDVIAPISLAMPPSAFAPEFINGFFVVPKLGGLAES